MSPEKIRNGDLESAVEKSGLPSTWSLATQSGTYRVTTTGAAHGGKTALVLAGSGGLSELQTTKFEAPGGAVLECQGWVQGDLRPGARVFMMISGDEPRKADWRSPIAEADQKRRDWQHLHFFCVLDQSAPKSTLKLAVSLEGEGLVRVDDLSLKVLPQTASRCRLPDAGFEQSVKGAAFPGWDFLFDGREGVAERVPDPSKSGNTCARIRGAEGWSVLVSHSPVSSKRSRILAQGSLWVHQGEGEIKIEYFLGKKCFASTRARLEKTDGWRLVSVEGEDEYTSQADEIYVTLGVSNPKGSYSVDFDDIDLIVID